MSEENNEQKPNLETKVLGSIRPPAKDDSKPAGDDPLMVRDSDTSRLKKVTPKTQNINLDSGDANYTDTVHLKIIKEKKKQLAGILTASQTIRLRPSGSNTQAESAQTLKVKPTATPNVALPPSAAGTLKVNAPVSSDTGSIKVPAGQSPAGTLKVKAPVSASGGGTLKIKAPDSSSAAGTLKIKAPVSEAESGGGTLKIKAPGSDSGAGTLKIKSSAPSGGGTLKIKSSSPSADETLKLASTREAKGGTLKMRAGETARGPATAREEFDDVAAVDQRAIPKFIVIPSIISFAALAYCTFTLVDNFVILFGAF